MQTLDPLYLANYHYRIQDYDACITNCTNLLQQNPRDQAAWFLKCKALSSKNYLDDIDMDDEGMADLLLDSNSTSDAPRPGTSFARPMTSKTSRAGDKPMTSSGRPITGVVRPGTSRPTTKGGSVIRGFTAKQALTSRPGTSKPVTQAGRLVRLGTASVFAAGQFVDTEHIQYEKYLNQPSLAKILIDYLLVVEQLPKRALELGTVLTKKNSVNDWFYFHKIAKCYYKLGLYKESESWFQKSLETYDSVNVVLEFSLVYIKLDLPNTALSLLSRALDRHPKCTSLMIQISRIHELLNNTDEAMEMFKTVLRHDPSNVEATASLAVHAFYQDQPETALRLYRRLLCMGVVSPELWNNIGLSAFYSGQYDISINCCLRAVNSQADDTLLAEIWYNISHIAIGVGDLNLAYQSLKICLSLDLNHVEALTNLAYLEMKRDQLDEARSTLRHVCSQSPMTFEPYYACACLYSKLGDFQSANDYVQKALACFDSVESANVEVVQLKEQLEHHFFSI
ncbi:hypothetical protein P9112_008909 [Eukaryota sp. TZLM1-RC]